MNVHLALAVKAYTNYKETKALSYTHTKCKVDRQKSDNRFLTFDKIVFVPLSMAIISLFPVITGGKHYY